MKVDLETAKEIGNKLGVDFNTIEPEQFRQGMNVELEHGKKDPETNVTNNNLTDTGKIAWQHLKESPDYYRKLKRVEAANSGTWLMKPLVHAKDYYTFGYYDIEDTKPHFSLMLVYAPSGIISYDKGHPALLWDKEFPENSDIKEAHTEAMNEAEEYYRRLLNYTPSMLDQTLSGQTEFHKPNPEFEQDLKGMGLDLPSMGMQASKKKAVELKPDPTFSELLSFLSTSSPEEIEESHDFIFDTFGLDKTDIFLLYDPSLAGDQGIFDNPESEILDWLKETNLKKYVGQLSKDWIEKLNYYIIEGIGGLDVWLTNPAFSRSFIQVFRPGTPLPPEKSILSLDPVMESPDPKFRKQMEEQGLNLGELGIRAKQKRLKKIADYYSGEDDDEDINEQWKERIREFEELLESLQFGPDDEQAAAREELQDRFSLSERDVDVLQDPSVILFHNMFKEEDTVGGWIMGSRLFHGNLFSKIPEKTIKEIVENILQLFPNLKNHISEEIGPQYLPGQTVPSDPIPSKTDPKFKSEMKGQGLDLEELGIRAKLERIKKFYSKQAAISEQRFWEIIDEIHLSKESAALIYTQLSDDDLAYFYDTILTFMDKVQNSKAMLRTIQREGYTGDYVSYLSEAVVALGEGEYRKTLSTLDILDPQRKLETYEGVLRYPLLDEVEKRGPKALKKLNEIAGTNYDINESGENTVAKQKRLRKIAVGERLEKQINEMKEKGLDLEEMGIKAKLEQIRKLYSKQAVVSENDKRNFQIALSQFLEGEKEETSRAWATLKTDYGLTTMDLDLLESPPFLQDMETEDVRTWLKTSGLYPWAEQIDDELVAELTEFLKAGNHLDDQYVLNHFVRMFGMRIPGAKKVPIQELFQQEKGKKEKHPAPDPKFKQEMKEKGLDLGELGIQAKNKQQNKQAAEPTYSVEVEIPGIGADPIKVGEQLEKDLGLKDMRWASDFGMGYRNLVYEFRVKDTAEYYVEAIKQWLQQRGYEVGNQNGQAHVKLRYPEGNDPSFKQEMKEKGLDFDDLGIKASLSARISLAKALNSPLKLGFKRRSSQELHPIIKINGEWIPFTFVIDNEFFASSTGDWAKRVYNKSFTEWSNKEKERYLTSGLLAKEALSNDQVDQVYVSKLYADQLTRGNLEFKELKKDPYSFLEVINPEQLKSYPFANEGIEHIREMKEPQTKESSKQATPIPQGTIEICYYCEHDEYDHEDEGEMKCLVPNCSCPGFKKDPERTIQTKESSRSDGWINPFTNFLVEYETKTKDKIAKRDELATKLNKEISDKLPENSDFIITLGSNSLRIRKEESVSSNDKSNYFIYLIDSEGGERLAGYVEKVKVENPKQLTDYILQNPYLALTTAN